MESEVVRTVTEPVIVEIDPIKGSRFIADLAPAADEAAARALLATVRARDPGANHHCWAYRLQSGREQADDDGEPRDTAGAPILRHLGGAGVVDVVCVVTRHFGGTKLGRGGLIRAYGAAAAAALDEAAIVERPVLATLEFVHDYSQEGVVQSVLSAHDIVGSDAVYGARTRRTVRLPKAQAADFRDALTEATAGLVRVERQPTEPPSEPG